jgi:tRNA (guanine37-N1)-methyltransferase
VLLSGDHREIGAWRRREALLRTWKKRPDLLQERVLTAEEKRWLAEEFE